MNPDDLFTRADVVAAVQREIDRAKRHAPTLVPSLIEIRNRLWVADPSLRPVVVPDQETERPHVH